MTVSIIVPVYNSREYIVACLDSIIRQDFADWECILVDDGSTDGSGDICDEYSNRDDRFVVMHKANGGVAAARNSALNEARGAWIAYVDSDDTLGPSYLSSLIESQSRSGSDFVLAGYRKIARDGEIESRTACLPSSFGNREVLDTILRYSKAPWAKLFSREIISENNLAFDSNVWNGEDLLFVLEYLKYCKNISVATSTEYYYYIRSGSLTNQGRFILDKELYGYNKFLRIFSNYPDLKGEGFFDKYIAYLTDRIVASLPDGRGCEVSEVLNQLDWRTYDNGKQTRGLKMKIMKYLLVHHRWRTYFMLIKVRVFCKRLKYQ